MLLRRCYFSIKLFPVKIIFKKNFNMYSHLTPTLVPGRAEAVLRRGLLQERRRASSLDPPLEKARAAAGAGVGGGSLRTRGG